MANEIEIANLALHRIGAGRIQSFNEASRESISCKLLYPFARESVLRDHDWQFARKRVLLALLNDTVSGWDFVYAYPADCMTAREIYYPAKPDPSDKIPFDVGVSTDKNSKVILTNQEEAELIYTAKVTNATVFDSLFCEALAYRLSSDLAQSLRGDPQMQQQFLTFYQRTLSDAKMQSANESYSDPSKLSDFTRSRS